MSMRAVPYYCPYCAEQSIEPVEDTGVWHCGSCNRRFELIFKGLGAP